MTDNACKHSWQRIPVPAYLIGIHTHEYYWCNICGALLDEEGLPIQGNDWFVSRTIHYPELHNDPQP